MRDSFVGDGALFEPDTLLPTQYFAHLRRRVPKEPEYLLVVAVLQDAIECVQKHRDAADKKRRQLYVDAVQWIVEDERSWPFSFVNVCELLGLNPEYVRRGILALDGGTAQLVANLAKEPAREEPQDRSKGRAA